MNQALRLPPAAVRPRLIAFVLIWIVAALASFAFNARIKSIVDQVTAPLASVMPQQLPGWEVLPDRGTVVNPQQEAVIEQIYDETISRTYRNLQSGEIVMLALAYGRDQSHKNQVHKPEVCYPSQGFRLSDVEKLDLPVAGRQLPSTRLTAQLGNRTEFVQYWMLQGDRVIRGALQQNLFRTRRALQGERTDGLLFRTSVIGGDAASSYRIQDGFIRDFIAAIPPAQQVRFVGK